MAEDRYDLIVVGAGAGGLAAAHRATELGARVLVLEKARRIGGSAALSAGILWTAPDLDVLRRIQPDGDPVLGPLLVAGYERAVQDVRDAGVAVSEEWDDHLEWGRACKIDIPGLFAAWSKSVVAAGGSILTEVRDVDLVQGDDGRVTGARFVHDGERITAQAGSVVLATGGFQGDPELTQTFIGHGADTIGVRSNPCSVGDGFRMGRAAGGAASRHLSTFYGHTLPSPLPVIPEVFLRLTLYFSAYGILVNRSGRRFTDESLGDEVSDQRLLLERDHRGVLIWDDSVQRERALAEPYPSGMVLDRFAEARALGARAAESDTLDGLVEQVSTWGVDRAALARTLADYSRAADGDEDIALDAPPSRNARALCTVLRSALSRSSRASPSPSAGSGSTAMPGFSTVTTAPSPGCMPSVPMPGVRRISATSEASSSAWCSDAVRRTPPSGPRPRGPPARRWAHEHRRDDPCHRVARSRGPAPDRS